MLMDEMEIEGMEKKAKVPKLRFPGFVGEWEQNKLNRYLIVSTEKNKNSRFSKQDVLSVSGEFGIVNQIELQGRSFAGASVEPYGVVNVGDVVYTKSPLNANPYGIVKVNKGKSGIVSTLYAIYKVKKGIMDPDFVQSYFELDNRMNRYMKPLVNIGAKHDMKISNANALLGLVVFPSLKEQQRITGFFKCIDSLITLHQRKLTHLQAKKKCLLQKMFPKKGEQFPELRFPGFTDKWNEQKLGELIESYSGGTPSVGKDEYYNGRIPFIRSAEINSDSTELYISERGLLNSSAKLVNAGDILYALYGATSGEVGIARIEGAINQAILAIRPKKNYDSYFIMQWLRSQKQEILDKYLQGGQGNLSGAIVRNLYIKSPNIVEQKRLGRFFQSIDNLIALHERKLAHLQTQKKALLQQMFV